MSGLIVNKMLLSGGTIYCRCQSCDSPCGKESFIQGISGQPPLFTPLENRIYSRIVFGVHPKIFTTRSVPLILEVAYFCNFCEWRPKGGPQNTAQDIIREIIMQKVLPEQEGKTELITGLGCWITFSRVREKKDKRIFNYQVSLPQLKEILVTLKEAEDNPFKIFDN